MNYGRWFTGALIAVLISLLVPVAPLAQASRTVYVDDTGTANPTGSGQCGRPNYATIQAAVDDMSAMRVIVCPGTYAEQVVVERSINLEGRSGAIIQAPPVLGASSTIVSLIGPQQSLLQGFAITGASTSDARLYAAVAVRDGAQVTITRNRIHNIPDNDPIFDAGHGIYISTASATITRNTIERYADHGILLSGTETFAMISDNTIAGRSTSGEGQIGIDIREGAQAEVEGNTVTGNTCDAGCTGIVVDQTAQIEIRSNEVRENDRGIVIGDEVADFEIRGNKVHHNTSHGLEIIEDEANAAAENLVVKNEFTHNGCDGIAIHGQQPPGTHTIIDSNKTSNNGGNGISLGPGAVGNTLKNNEAIKNGGFDIIDANGGPPANVYVNNKCSNSNPDGLCKD